MPRVQPNQTDVQNVQSNKLKKILLIVGSIVILLIFCMLLGTFVIVNVWFDDCDHGYTGEDCNACDAGFHRNVENCIEGTCSNIGTLQVAKNGSCSCKSGFVGSQCNACDTGLSGDYCNLCSTGYHKQNNICREGDCHAEGTNRRGSDGSCDCLPKFSGARCNETVDIILNCTSIGTMKEGSKNCSCKVGFIGSTCELCDNGFIKTDDGDCVLDDTEQSTTLKTMTTSTTKTTTSTTKTTTSTTKTTIVTSTTTSTTVSNTCEPGFSGENCDECANRFTGTNCNQCVQGYMGTYCNICNFGFHKAEDNKCLEGDCNLIGTDSRNSDGSCVCKITFAGYQCNKCYIGYNGTYCDICANGFHNIDGNCFVGECNIVGTSQKDPSGKCICKEAFAGYTCHECQVGYRDNDCTSCESGYYQYNGTCYKGECSFPGTKVQEINGICTCKEGYTGAQCDECNKGSHLAFGYCNAGECNDVGTEYKTTWGECQCKNTFEGTTCETCVITWSGDNCDQCSNGYIMVDGTCQEGECNADGTDIRTNNGTCSCKTNIVGSTCDKCKEGYWGVPANCTECGCNSKGTVDESETCDDQGKCDCKSGYVGHNCDHCQNGYYFDGDLSSIDCKKCDCNVEGSDDTKPCNSTTGICNCKDGVEGGRCTKCKPNRYAFPFCIDCECDPNNSTSLQCQNDGQCDCKTGFYGKQCNGLFKLKTKLLVTTGSGSSDTNSQIIDLQNPYSKCENWANFPIQIVQATGQVIGTDVIICGGAWPGMYTSNCYKLGPESVVSLPNLSTAKSSSSSGVFNNALFVTGGNDGSGGSGGYFSTTEYISENERQDGVSMPIKVDTHCVIQVNENEILLTGGNNEGEYQKDTYFFKNDVQQWKKGPPMAKTRRYHGCGAFTLQNQLVLVVAGDRSSTNRKSVEFLLPNTSEPTWIAGPDLPASYDFICHEIVSDGNTLYYVNTWSNVILRLDCPSDLASCKWTKLLQKLTTPKQMSLAFLVPDELTECSEN